MNKLYSILPSLCLLLGSSGFTPEATADCVSSVLSKRYSTRSYNTAKQVSQKQIQAIIEAGRSTPSCYNEQPWNFIICDRTTNPDAYNTALNGLVEFNQNWAKNAPVLVIAISSNNWARDGQPNQWALFDTGAATYGMMIQATSLGLSAHQMGGFDEEKLKKSFEIPSDYTIISVMSIGYAASNDTQPERQRKATNDNFFIGSWGKKT